MDAILTDLALPRTLTSGIKTSGDVGCEQHSYRPFARWKSVSVDGKAVS
ncbi:hypothetical protein OAF83_00685 [Rubripirellula sp.]|nr:hypothetical protein [Rubripirellula sp.]MDB4749397.1 hypothetical protein [Rubripirellula sp.]